MMSRNTCHCYRTIASALLSLLVVETDVSARVYPAVSRTDFQAQTNQPPLRQSASDKTHQRETESDGALDLEATGY